VKTILREGETCWVHERVDEAGVLVDGESYYSMFYRAAERAETYILLSGWQFDSKVELLRGEEAARARALGGAPTTLLAFLEDLCAAKPSLRVYVLAWDFSVFFALEREWLQKVAFDWMTHEHLNFAFDTSVPIEGAHHQKFAVIDGVLGFVGGTDLCEHRWDDRAHRLENPARFTAEGEFYPPYHEIHSYMRGRAVGRLVEFFAKRWTRASKAALVLAERSTPLATPENDAIRIPAREVALCRTSVAGPEHPCHDIREMYVRAVHAAERLVYVETQYLTAHAVVDALVARMRAKRRSKLDLVFVLPTEPEAPKEELAMGILQARAVQRLVAAAAETGHHLGLYSSVAVDDRGRDVATYIHSKMIVVDDRFLSLGSANLSNRSMGVDTELNVAFETDDERSPLARAIRRLRVSLLAEHTGSPGSLRTFVRSEGLVDRLDAMAADSRTRLRRYVSIDPSEHAPLMTALHASVGQYLDPDRPRLEEDLEVPERWVANFSRGIAALRERFLGPSAG
jgi:phosphatidylserine/phosphatidylglycerophosphate/cardiolipin synthase-like enzyme